MPVSKYRFNISFDVGEAYRVEIKNKIVQALSAMKTEGKNQ